MSKTYLISTPIPTHQLRKLEVGDKIQFEMPPFCSGDYSAIVERDDRGLFIPKSDDSFAGCRDWKIVPDSDRENKEGWDKIFKEFNDYRSSLDNVRTVSAMEFFLKTRYNFPTKKS